MIQLKRLIILLVAIFLLKSAIGQSNSGRGFSQMLQSYYLYKDKDLVEKTIDFANHTSMDYKSLQPILTGFFGALFSFDLEVKQNFQSKIATVEKPDLKNLFSSLIVVNMDSFYRDTKISTTYNDMNWSSYFATGSTKYLDNIIANLPLSENRIDINLFLAGATAKWSLSSNAAQDEKVKYYLNSLKSGNATIVEILQKDPNSFKAEMVDILKKQKAAGVWN